MKHVNFNNKPLYKDNFMKTTQMINVLKVFAKNELYQNILPFWTKYTVDEMNGGFVGRINENYQIDVNSDKELIFNARILWTFSAACRKTNNKIYRKLADWAYGYISRYFYDREYKDYNWKLDCKGYPLKTKKQVYTKTFVIYALLEYYMLTGLKECLDKAIEILELIEKYSFDPLKQGYFEEFDRLIKHAETIPASYTNDSLKTIKIFLASSSELKDDREHFEIFINRENKKLIKKRIFLELILWEDFLDSMSKEGLQNEYNKAAKNSDIFIMLAFNKVGKYTAGEFETAFGKFKKTNRPFIFTYFKKPYITQDRSELKSLWTFEDKLKKLRHYPLEYKNTEDLMHKFDEQLEKVLIKLKLLN